MEIDYVVRFFKVFTTMYREITVNSYGSIYTNFIIVYNDLKNSFIVGESFVNIGVI